MKTEAGRGGAGQRWDARAGCESRGMGQAVQDKGGMPRLGREKVRSGFMDDMARKYDTKKTT